MEIHQLTLAMYRRAQFKYGDDAGCNIVSKLTEDALGEYYRAEGFENWAYENDFSNGSCNIIHKNLK